MSKNLDVVAIGNALVDVLAKVDDEFIDEKVQAYSLNRGAMTLVDRLCAVELYSALPERTEASGGSAANTMAGLASFGGKGAFIGKVADDDLGQAFADDLQTKGIDFHTVPLTGGDPTGCCLIMVDDAGERTMNTFLGASTMMNESDIDEELIKSAQVLYLEGYLFDKEEAKNAFRTASKIAKDHDTKVALTLSDPFCVDRHKSDFIDLVDHHVDILFCNEAEIMALYDAFDWDQVPAILQQKDLIAAMTRSAQGSVIVEGRDIYDVPARPTNVVDTTGAGDAYAAGFLYGYTRGLGLYRAGELGSMAASQVIETIGPRSEQGFADLLDKKIAS